MYYLIYLSTNFSNIVSVSFCPAGGHAYFMASMNQGLRRSNENLACNMRQVFVDEKHLVSMMIDD